MIVSMDIRDVQGFALRVRNKNETDTSIATSPLSPLLLHNHVYKLYTLQSCTQEQSRYHVFNLSVWKCGDLLSWSWICIYNYTSVFLQVIFSVSRFLSDVSCNVIR